MLAREIEDIDQVFADETTAPVLDPGRGRTKIGQLWAYARDDRPWGGADPPSVAYVYAPDRKAERPMTYLAGFTGILQVNGYAGYRALAERGDVQLAFCWATFAAASMNSRSPAPHRSPARRSNTSLNSTPWRPNAGAKAPMSGALSGRRKAGPFSLPLSPGSRPSSA